MPKTSSLTARRKMIRNLAKKESRPRQSQIQFKSYKKAGGKSSYKNIIK